MTETGNTEIYMQVGTVAIIAIVTMLVIAYGLYDLMKKRNKAGAIAFFTVIFFVVLALFIIALGLGTFLVAIGEALGIIHVPQ